MVRSVKRRRATVRNKRYTALRNKRYTKGFIDNARNQRRTGVAGKSL